MKPMQASGWSLAAILCASLMAGCAREAGGSAAEPDKPHPEAGAPANDPRLLVGRSALIFKGVVSGIEYQTDAKSGLPYTYVTFRQIEPITDRSGEFGASKRQTMRLRLFGGLKENGTMTVMSHVPAFQLGAVYIVFHTAGEWDVSPVVGGERGVFQVIRSRTLGYEMVFDYFGDVVVGLSDQGIQTLPLDSHALGDRPRMPEPRSESSDARQTDQVKIERQSIYSEENVKRMMDGQEPAPPELEKGDLPGVRARMLKELASQPLSLEAFRNGLLEIDRRHAKDFHASYSRLVFEGRPVARERRPGKLNPPGEKQ